MRLEAPVSGLASLEGGHRPSALADSPVLLDVRGLTTKFYTVDGVVNALNGISYSVRKGECLAIVGESGSGKTVGVLSILRLIQSPPGRIVGGSITFKGTDLLTLDDNALREIRGGAISVIFQDPMTSLNPVMRVGAQISENIMAHEALTRRQARAKATDMLARVGIPAPAKRLDDYPHQFSGGMRQRVMIAMALSCSPQLIIADEPTTALDVTIQAQIVELVKTLQSELGTAVIWISHDLGVVARLADTVAVMYAGHIVESAPVDELYARPAHPYTIGLLNSLPRLDARVKTKLEAIGGLPPNLLGELRGCPFAPRCAFVTDRCRQQNPPLVEVVPGHSVACWHDRLTGGQP
jgi:oligopeptide transport system ATP-binding protein